MNIGFIGLGKLGLPVSVAMCLNTVDNFYVYDSDAAKWARYREGRVNLYEPNITERLKQANDSGRYHYCGSLRNLTESTPEIIFVAVPTPSAPSKRFNLVHLKEVLAELNTLLLDRTTVAVISTVLPGDVRRELTPVCGYQTVKGFVLIGPHNIDLVYNPSFIAMGTTIADFLSPEFVLMGTEYGKSNLMLEKFYRGLYTHISGKSWPPILPMTWEEAEMTKMAYNTMIGFKIVYANALMEMAHKVGHASVDVVSDALGHATKRITSSTYLRGGMGDGGSCHPRDNLALGALARDLHLSADPFAFVMEARMKQAEWIAELLLEQELPVVLMGKRYKPNTNLTDYSAAQLVESLIHVASPETEVEYYDPLLGLAPAQYRSSVFLICHTFDFVEDYDYPSGSVIIDPWRCLSETTRARAKLGVRYVPLGVS